MITCPACENENPDTNSFCGSCGSGLELVCSNCGTVNPPSNGFCGSCGSSLSESAAAPVAVEAAPAVAERRLVTVLFADLTGFTPFSEARDPEEVRSFLTQYFDRSREVIETFGGVVDKFIGDAVMAVWGATVANEDDAERAVRAGLELADAISTLGSENDVPELAVRVGILTGEASVGPGGNEQGLVVGDMVNTASRLQSIADPGTVLVGDATRRAIGDAIAFTELGDQTVKGKEIPVAAFRADRVRGPVGEEVGRSIEPPFVGRVDDLRLLKDMYAAVRRENRMRLVSIIGQGGIGKSRLIEEFGNYLDGIVDTVYWHEGRSPSYGDGVTLWALGEMVRSRARIAEIYDEVTTRELLRDAIRDWIPDDEEAEWLEPRLASLLGVGDSTVGDQAELFAAFRTFFERIAERSATVLIFEDFHSADPALLDFVEQLPEWSRNHPILVVTLGRPDLLERRPGWGQGRHGFVSMHLGPLADIDMIELVDGMTPGVDAGVRDAIIERAAGIPLYAVEMVRMMLAGGELTESDGVYSYQGDVTDLAVPESLQAVIGARLDRLEPAERELLQDASIAGFSFTLDTLAHIIGDENGDLEGRLTPLVQAELLEVNRDPRSPERGQYRFVQGLIREVAHGRISREVRIVRHVEAARYLEGLGPELAVVVAAHYLEAYEAATGDQAIELRAKARDALLAASDRAADLHSYEQVRSLAEQALDATDEDAERAPIWERIAEAAGILAENELAVESAKGAIDHYQAAGDDDGLNRTVHLLAAIYNDANLSQRAVDLLEPHLEGADLESDPNLAIAASDLARAYLLTGKASEETAAAAEAALPALEGFELTRQIAEAMITRGTALGATGRIRQGLALIKGGLELADAEGFAFTSIRGRINLTYIGSVEDPVMGFNAYREAYDIARRTGQRGMTIFLNVMLTGFQVVRGELDAVETLATDPIFEGAPLDSVGQSVGQRGRGADLRGDLALGRALFEEATVALEQTEDFQVGIDLDVFRNSRSLIEGRFGDAFDGSLAVARRSTRPVAYTLNEAAAAAYLTGNREWLAEVLDVYREAGVMARDLATGVEAVSGLFDDPTQATVRRVEALMSQLDDRVLAVPAAFLAAALALHGPESDRDRLDADFRARADKYGFAGIVNLYEGLLDD
ncbi:MAG: adenylate/guanylate cyclase domain-containing protein [Acidimicrobiia bacterium]|nr:MAG: adenylate/guanylate cyclase domain-containing protein [Acidimicrobiia bacterium]